MASCTGVNTLDPYQSIIDALNKGAKSLENQAQVIQPFIDQFDLLASAITTPSLPSVLNNALNQFTADAICAASTDLQPINDLVGDCLSSAMASVKAYLKNIMSNIEDGISLINDLITLPEGILFTYYQKIWGLCDTIKDLITSLDNKIQCVSLSDVGSLYQDQIDDLNDRISGVTDDLRLAADGSFDADTFLSGLGTSLKDNVKSFADKSTSLKDDIENNVSSTIDLAQQINPTNYF